MMFMKIAITLLCLGDAVRGSPTPTPLPDTPCVPGGCAPYIAGDLQCPGTMSNGIMVDDTPMYLSHPTDCRKFCQCDHQGDRICERDCPSGTHWHGEYSTCITAEGDCSIGDACVTNPCIHGTCSIGGAPTPDTAWNCACDGGNTDWFGWNCQFPVDEACNLNLCATGLTCENVVSSWWPYVPYTCVDDVCTPDPCNGETCNVVGTEYVCNCGASGKFGDNCQCTGTNPCDSGPCQNGGTCELFPNSCTLYSCKCPVTHIGRNCETTVACTNSVCHGKEDGHYPHPDSCAHYCSCVSGLAYLTACPSGLVFDPVLCRCEYFGCTP